MTTGSSVIVFDVNETLSETPCTTPDRPEKIRVLIHGRADLAPVRQQHPGLEPGRQAHPVSAFLYSCLSGEKHKGGPWNLEFHRDRGQV